MGPEDLRHALAALPRGPKSQRLLVGPETWDDAGVYRLTPSLAIAQTVDFITPIVDDPRAFGAIAAANALSDIYAMGARPTLALSIVCFPSDTADPRILRLILAGGAAKLRQAGVTLLGGHSVRDREMKFGFAVTGEVHPKRIVTNAGARTGQVLVLTKPIGTGILATALKRQKLAPDAVRRLTRQMSALNAEAARVMTAAGVRAGTDVSGFGLLGHALNIARMSRKTLRIWAPSVPFLPGVLELAAQGVVPGGLENNLSYLNGQVTWPALAPLGLRRALSDPQTSGGLLLAVPPRAAAGLIQRLRHRRVAARVIGEVCPRGRRPLEVSI
jgi:selenide, water dikinase